MVRPGRDRLSGMVEVDETYLGGPEGGVRGRQTEKKALIVVAAQANGKGIGRIRMQWIPDASAESLIPFVEESMLIGLTPNGRPLVKHRLLRRRARSGTSAGTPVG